MAKEFERDEIGIIPKTVYIKKLPYNEEDLLFTCYKNCCDDLRSFIETYVEQELDKLEKSDVMPIKQHIVLTDLINTFGYNAEWRDLRQAMDEEKIEKNVSIFGEHIGNVFEVLMKNHFKKHCKSYQQLKNEAKNSSWYLNCLQKMETLYEEVTSLDGILYNVYGGSNPEMKKRIDKLDQMFNAYADQKERYEITKSKYDDLFYELEDDIRFQLYPEIEDVFMEKFNKRYPLQGSDEELELIYNSEMYDDITSSFTTELIDHLQTKAPKAKIKRRTHFPLPIFN